ncbi:hypothetical protein CIRG_06089 [Coccidioides immitis RMSCC 2394]|uniref:Uncharacterized protein n=1 Tax=Coccidioides immitis RMSCC 2394 TaxID=404692 RepID=A0A0J6YHN3_COCIT|nr:hypothetical protein CIRG_06089 [Coccidioides immitis RMSCC 2394]
MAYAHFVPFGKHGQTRDSPFSPGSCDPLSISARRSVDFYFLSPPPGIGPRSRNCASPGTGRDHGIQPPWDTSEASRAYSNRIVFVSFVPMINILIHRHLSCHGQLENNWRKHPINGGLEMPASTCSDIRAPKTLISGEPNLFPERLKRRATDSVRGAGRYHSQRRPGNRDEFDGPTQLLDMPSAITVEIQEDDLPLLPTTLDVQEQDQILSDVNDRLSKCAFDFVAKYQFPIPLESDKKHVRSPQDREWTEWVYLLKRLATKRRIPARVLYNGQIKQFVTVLENALETRHVTKNQNRPLKDDRNILQFISAGTQVAKILKDASAMEYFDWFWPGMFQFTPEEFVPLLKLTSSNTPPS